MNNDRDQNRRGHRNGPRNGNGERRSASRGHSSNNNQHRNNDRNYRKNDNEKFKRNFPIAYKKLEEMLQLTDDAELILKLSSESYGFLLLLRQNGIKEGLMCLILKAFAKVSDCATDDRTQQLLIHFLMKILPTTETECTFFKQELRLFITFLPKRTEPTFRDHECYIQSIVHLLKFLRKLQLIFHMRSSDVVSSIAPLITAQVEYINRKGNILSEETNVLLAEINSTIDKGAENQEENEKAEVLFEPPEDYRTISIFPTSNDIQFNHEPFIRKNIIDGKYIGGVDHYLDVQFRLLREDFVRPLREGISEYLRLKRDKEDAKKLSKIKDINIYFNCHMVKSLLKSGDLIYTIQFDAAKFKNVRWQASKRFLHGSLVCLTADDFETFCFATVTGYRNPDNLEKGLFDIIFQFQNRVTDAITPMTTLTIVESQVYFEAYRHNLTVLQDLDTNSFPLKKYIIDVERNVSPPPYVHNDTLYDLSMTIAEFNSIKEDDLDRINQYELTGKMSRCSNVRILHDDLWPGKEDFGLDDSQFAAYKAALTEQFVVIQGPPGTGKTFIGLKIAKALLENVSQWQKTRLSDSSPILVVCYTNHALDQFLEGILTFCESIVRIGAKSQSEALQAYNLITLKTKMKTNRTIPEHIYRNRWESLNALKLIQEEMAKLEKNIEAARKEVLGLQLMETIQNFSHNQFAQLHEQGQFSRNRLLEWLGYQMRTIPVNQNYMPEEENGDEKNGENAKKDDTNDENNDNESIVDEEEVKEIENMRQFDMESDSEEEGVANEPDTNTNNNVLVNYVPVQLDDGFQYQRHDRKKMKLNFLRELKSEDVMSADEAALVTDIWRLTAKNRWRLYRFWSRLYVETADAQIKVLRQSYTRTWRQFTALRNEEDIAIVKGKKVIAMTTTGAAKYHHIISAIKPRIVIVEEAAEVLEAHIITSLSRETDHLVLIGDHQQLKPNPAVYELARKFNLEVSLFERMITNGLNCYQLKTQHRMRPCISELLVPHIYKELLDHPSVHAYKDIKGISTNMFFVNHAELESHINDTKSHKNVHEANFIVELCRYLVLQGYKTSQITILTMYSGQLFEVKRQIRKIGILTGVRATVVDNYQGEENDIILMTFVRSNIEGEIGFLKVSNRINVSLSRARKGLYCIGNFDCLAEKSDLWRKIIKVLESNQAYGEALPIYCQNHPDTKALIVTGDDFKQAPEGGCLQPCGARLPCGHCCPSICHIADAEHENTKCHKPCENSPCELGHSCNKLCHFGETCGQCQIKVPKKKVECGHMVQVKCSENPSSVSCKNLCDKTRLCGHPCKLQCFMVCESVPCQFEVEVTGPCKHKVTVRCAQSTNETLILESCRAPCKTALECQHTCRGSCGQCKQGRLHTRCREKCSKILVCGHKCKDNCSVNCPPCTELCKIQCSHSACKLKCGELCALCIEKCSWRCEHLKCTRFCKDPCNRELCKEPCVKKLKCGHNCIGVCGEICPKLCRICNKEEVEEFFFGREDEPDARFIQMVDCPHFIEVTGLIHWLEMDGSNNSSSGLSIQLKSCPKCKAIIRKTKSLNTFIQKALKDIENVKAKTAGNDMENRAKQTALNLVIKEKIDNIEKFESKTMYIRKGFSLFLRLFHDTEIVKKRKPKPKTELLRIENVLEILTQIDSIFQNVAKARYGQYKHNIDSKIMEKIEARTLQSLIFLYEFNNSKQQRTDVSNEIQFFEMVGRYLKEISEKVFNETGQKLIKEAFSVALTIGRVTQNTRDTFKRLIVEASQHTTGIGVSLEEKNMILNAMGFQQGHWYKCPNGHVYAIADCGGATMESKCNECGAKIGGGSHRLRTDNAVATEMDGATTSAWPTNLEGQLRAFMD